MSWDRQKYHARCADCGKEGFCIEASDDWGQSSTEWIGFNTEAPHPYEVGRKRADPRSPNPVCKCGSKNVRAGALLGECDFRGDLLKR